ncbi:MAG: tRNA (N6-isopentenyl adenosine(37)-C2)-methylthiotransferase MiaB [Thermoleophilia bacterium]|nr:tRNA (N6-isopentenyl adenosine(37)-C2)-methylthiotransferase MiaB [Thermoleophilia bacterium]
MNAHDSERITGMLESRGMVAASDQDDADVVVFNTCTIREKPDQKLYTQLDQAKGSKRRRGGNQVIAVGGCLVEAQRDNLLAQFPWVDVAFGPGRIRDLGNFLELADGEGARIGQTPGDGEGFYGIADERSFASELPTRRDRPHQAWVQISMGCNMKCSYCIVPAVRGREVSRSFTDIVTEVELLAADGAREITLLGQNVNSYGNHLPRDGSPRTFAELLRAVDAIDGIDRVRYTSPHPAHMRADVIAAMAECETVMPQLHLPLQAGSSRVLKAMRRTYSRERFVDLAAKIRASIPDISFTTDIIVGFPGETEAEFLETVEVCREVQFDGAFTFIYSARTGTEAAGMEADFIPPAEQQRRLEHLVGVVRAIAEERHQRHVGTVQDVLVEGTARKPANRLRGRSPHNVTVIFEGDTPEGTIVPVRIVHASSETLLGRQVDGQGEPVAAPTSRGSVVTVDSATT